MFCPPQAFLQLFCLVPNKTKLPPSCQDWFHYTWWVIGGLQNKKKSSAKMLSDFLFMPNMCHSSSNTHSMGMETRSEMCIISLGRCVISLKNLFFMLVNWWLEWCDGTCGSLSRSSSAALRSRGSAMLTSPIATLMKSRADNKQLATYK